MRVSKKFSLLVMVSLEVIKGCFGVIEVIKRSNKSCDEAKFKLGGDKNLNFNQLVIFYIRSIF